MTALRRFNIGHLWKNVEVHIGNLKSSYTASARSQHYQVLGANLKQPPMLGSIWVLEVAASLQP